MLTVEVKLNGQIIAEATLQNESGLAHVSTYFCRWVEGPCDELGIPAASGRFLIKRHARRQSAWALVARAVVEILGQLPTSGRGSVQPDAAAPSTPPPPKPRR
ncbi:MAG: hypothetical protein Q7J44_14135 [Pseudotabrizicola sp.]|uniref:hypothetical protein n=1 Tax=Pseudotabrizicola sp. TaxID=2939647 RepID=UPI00271C296D|nr:hypothetical protein [Pseudotabrizicola sp.]MDO9639675.1 hypothetical protein [Pseudotabrizicola sp.]